MEIVGPKTKLKHVKRIPGEKTADGRAVTWSDPVRFEGVMTLLAGRERIFYQQMKVQAKYKVLTNYLKITEEDRVQRDSVEYDVTLVDDKHFMDKIAVVLLDG